MNRILSVFCACIAISSLIAVAKVNTKDDIKTRILRLFPDADANGDGAISDKEEAALARRAIARHPKADANSDGILSTKEKHALLSAAEQKFKKDRNDTNSISSRGISESDDLGPGTKSMESPVRRGPQLVKPGEHGIGKQIPQLPFQDINGQTHSLADFADRKAIVFAMTGTGCPLCLKYAPTLASIEKQYRSRGVEFIYINPNQSEQKKELIGAIETHGFQGPYVQDGEKELPLALNAKTTTEVFVLDRARTLVFRGAVDDQYGFGYSLEVPRRHYLVDALDAALEGRTPAIQATTSPGCELYYTSDATTEHTITYHNRISRIIQANCLECHRTEGTAPMAFESYEGVKDYAGMIGDVVQRGIMPPWFAAPAKTGSSGEPDPLHWANDRSLSDAEKNDLFKWINTGAPEGDPADKPLAKTFPNGWLIGKPDTTFRLPKPIPVQATGTMPYEHVTIATQLPEDKWVKAIEIRPGAPDVVHHVIVYIKPESPKKRQVKEFWAGYAPGNSTWIYPDGYARRLPKGATLEFEMHYTPNGKKTFDQTEIGLIYADEPPHHEIRVAAIANRKLEIPPRAANHRVDASLTLPYDAQILSFLPHMHLRGKSARYELLSNGTAKTLLDVPHYDFNWQLLYRLAEPLTLEKGNSIRFTGWFDNSADNPANPDPNVTVHWGQQTEDEMHVGYVEYVVSGAVPGSPIAAMRPARPASQTVTSRPSRNKGNAVQISGHTVQRNAIVDTLRKLDSDNDGRVSQSQIPEKYIQIFNAIDSNSDGVVTDKEVMAALN